MTISAPLVAVFGATGNQGASVVRSLLKNPGFRVRALTRNPNSKASQALAAQGAELYQADGFIRSSLDAAFAGCWGIFVNINSDDEVFRSDTVTEFDLGKTIVDAAAEARVRHFVFSSGPPCTEMTGGRVRMKAMDMKYKIEQYARAREQFQTTAFINAAWFLENFLAKEVATVFGGFPWIPDAEGYLTFRVPYWGSDERVPWVSVIDDFGDIVQGLFLDPARWNGCVVHGCSDIRSFDQMVSDFSRATGKKARFQPILPSWEAFDTKDIPELEDVKLMFGFTQNTGGRYFGPDPSENRTAAELKQATARALGQSRGQQRLITVERWFQTYITQ